MLIRMPRLSRRIWYSQRLRAAPCGIIYLRRTPEVISGFR